MGRPTGPTEAAAAAPEPGASQPGVAWTRFAPAPTGFLHLGHVANAIFVWGLAAATGAKVLLRIEDHDRERSRTAFDSAILEDLEWLGFAPDAGPVRQHDDPAPYLAAAEWLRAAGLAYACDCTRSKFASSSAGHGGPWRGPGCPGGCHERDLTEDPWLTLRVALGAGQEPWADRILGPQAGDVALAGDLAIRDRQGNWTYGLCVVVDDLRQSVSLVVRGEDLADVTPAQVRLARLLGRTEPATFAHHPLIRKPTGAKLSKADGDTGVGELRAAGRTPEEVIGEAAAAVGLLAVAQPIGATDVGRLVEASISPG
jgi:glutamyl-Q tRNA(Asp) synthetase